MYAALLDACVLVPVALGDTVLRLAEQGLFRPLWSAGILDETGAAIGRIRPDLAPARIERRLQAMRAAFPDAMVDGHLDLVAALQLPDPDDRHVLAAAIAGGAQTLVTHNIRDFPVVAISAHHIEVVDPDTFLLDQLDLAPESVALSIVSQIRALRTPGLDTAEVLASLGAAGAPRFAEAIRPRLRV